MITSETATSMHFVVNDKGQRTAVLLDIRAWEKLIELIEMVADTRMAIQALHELEEAGGRPQRAGWLAWDDISEEWGDEKEAEITVI